ncbi:MAG: hypothetical protein V3T83_00230, partial [Acidobacteriota bacterium]
QGMLRRYGWFYAFAGISAVGGAARLIAVHVVEGGLSSWTFIHVYYWTEALQLVAALPVLWWLYRLDGRALKARPLLLTVLPALLVLAVSFSESNLHVYTRSVNAGHCFLAFAAFAVLLRRSATPELYLGRNAKVILCTIFLPSFVASCNLMLHFAGSDWWPLAIFQHLEEPVGLIVWITAFMGLRSLDPPRVVAAIDQEEVRRRLTRGLRIVRDLL